MGASETEYDDEFPPTRDYPVRDARQFPHRADHPYGAGHPYGYGDPNNYGDPHGYDDPNGYGDPNGYEDPHGYEDRNSDTTARGDYRYQRPNRPPQPYPAQQPYPYDARGPRRADAHDRADERYPQPYADESREPYEDHLDEPVPGARAVGRHEQRTTSSATPPANVPSANALPADAPPTGRPPTPPPSASAGPAPASRGAAAATCAAATPAKRGAAKRGAGLVAAPGHGHSHSHGHSHGPIPIGPIAARVVIGLLTLIGVASVIGAIVLWPDRVSVDVPTPFQSADGSAVESVDGSVVEQSSGLCPSPSVGRVFTGSPLPSPAGGYECPGFIVSIDSGPNAGTRTLLEITPGPGQPDLQVGDQIRLIRGVDTSGTAIYGFDDFQRGGSLLLVVVVFVVVIVGVAGLRGLRALIGLALAFGVIVGFVLPALLDDKPPVPVAVVGGSLILYVVLYLAHGINLRTSAALLGTLTSMLVAAVGSVLVIDGTGVTGLSEEQNTNIQTYLEHVSIVGLLLAGFIIGSLGVLNDVTITQASATFELAAANPGASRRQLFGGAMRVGRDHIASTVYTLLLAYAGGALPLLLLLSVAGRPLGDLLTGDAIATEIARSAVGGIALTLSVPLTTAIAAILARPPSRVGGRHST